MAKGIEDLRETAPCGMVVHYTVDKETDMVIYNDICDRGNGNESDKCIGCSWRGICNPTELKLNTITMESLIERLKRDTSEHGAITGEFCGTYAVLQHKWRQLVRYCTIRDTVPEDRESVWREIDDILSFIRGMLYGLEAGRLITSGEHDILDDTVTYTAYPKLD